MKKIKLPIDLSMLTPEEADQFREDPSTLYGGNTKVCLYLRFSSEKQKEQSIEGQLRDCRAYCKTNNYQIAAVYVDRATTARKDSEKRISFQQMISDSDKKPWQYVVVWKLDRFARNRTDSALFKFKLRKNGVQVLSATEHISDNPEGIILEAVLEGMAEFYSADLSQKITRGMRESALKCQNLGGYTPLGYRIENHKLVPDPATAPIVKEAFELYASGETAAELCRIFNAKGYRTSKNAAFNRNSFKRILSNERYIGVYSYKDLRVEGGIPAIIDKELFDRVQERLSENAKSPARGKAKVNYLLSGKIFCGHCGEPMDGESGTGRHNIKYHYYACYGHKIRHTCDKKAVKKDWIERIVVEDAMAFLTDDIIEELANTAVKQTEQDIKENTRIPELANLISETERGISNISSAIEKGIASETLMNRLVELEKQKKDYQKQLRDEEKHIFIIDKDQVIFWLEKFKSGNIEDESFRRTIIDLVVNSVTVWDEPDGFKITTAYNLTSHKNKTYRVKSNSENRLEFENPRFTIGVLYEPLIIQGSIVLQTKKHPLLR